MEHNISEILITIGGVMLLGLMTDLLGRKTFLPRVTLLLLFGMVIGPGVLDLLPEVIYANFDLFADIALLMIGFLVGGRLTTALLRKIGQELLAVSLGPVLGTIIVVTLVLVLFGVPIELAIMLGCIATATDPAATVDVIEETGSKGEFVDLLTAIVALDDAWGLIVFSLGVALIGLISGANGLLPPMLVAFREVFGGILLGVAIGIPAAYLTGRIQPGKPIMFEALGVVFLCGGLAIFFSISFLLSAIVMGLVIVNLAEHHDYPFHAIEDIESPFLILFFVLAGASLEFSSLLDIGLIGLVYVIARIVGKYIGVLSGANLCHAEKSIRNWMGVALLPQAGVAMGMALVAANHLPEYRQLLLSIVISTTIVFELIGPILARLALHRVKAVK